MKVRKVFIISGVIISLFVAGLLLPDSDLIFGILLLPTIWMIHYRNIRKGWFWIIFLLFGALGTFPIENPFVSVFVSSISFPSLIFAIRRTFFVRGKNIKTARQETEHELGTFTNNPATIKKGQLFKGLIKKMTARWILIASIVAFLLLTLGGGMLYANYIQDKTEVSKKNVELREKELELAKEKLEYQKEKDLEKKQEEQAKTLQDNINERQNAIQDNWNRARAECVAIADKNLQSFKELVESCQTQLCVDNVLANKDLQYFGEAFIKSCTEKRL